MPRVVAVAVVRDDPPEVFIAEDQETLNWVLALQLIARTDGSRLDPDFRDALRQALRDEQWGNAVEMWMAKRAVVDVYSSHDLYVPSDVEMAAQELEFSPLFRS